MLSSVAADAAARQDIAPEPSHSTLAPAPGIGQQPSTSISTQLMPTESLPFYANTQQAAEEAVLEGRERCLFVEDCNTGSALRKAISHFFGRNKSCTKRIPSHIWVYYCRKHYQRIRYRNADTYPHNQMDLILLQLRRLQAWDARCRREGSSQRIEYWTLCLRKREKNRQTTDADSSDDESADIAVPPEWLKARVDGRFTTPQIIEIAERLRSEVKNGTLPGIPEIEFLPEIPQTQTAQSRRPTRRNRRQQQSVDERTSSKRKASASPEKDTTDPTRSASFLHPYAVPQPGSQARPRIEPVSKRARVSGHAGHRRSQTLDTTFTFPAGPPSEPFTYARPHNQALTQGYYPRDPAASGRPSSGPSVQPIPENRSPIRDRNPHTRSRSTYEYHPPGQPMYGQYETGLRQPFHQPSASTSSRGGVTLPSLSAQLPEHAHTRFSSQDSWERRQSSQSALSGSSASHSSHHRSTSAVTPQARPMWDAAPYQPGSQGPTSSQYNTGYYSSPTTSGYPTPTGYGYGTPGAERTLPPLQPQPGEQRPLHQESSLRDFSFPPRAPPTQSAVPTESREEDDNTPAERDPGGR